MRDWITTTIGEFIDFNPSEKLQKNKIAKKIPMDKLGTFERKIKGFVFAEYQSGPKFRNNDTLVAKITPCLENGKTAFVNILDNEEVAFGSSEFIVLRNNKLSDAKFIYYLARSPYFREKAISCMEGTSGRKRVNETALKHLNIKVPPLKTQQKIAKILSDIDDKIEILHQINDNLAELAKTIYDYWFVQFDFPDENGKPYKTSGGKMVYNEVLKREIPEGWEVKRIEEVIEPLESGKRPKGGIDKTLKEGIPSLGAECIDELGIFDFSSTRYIPYSFQNKIKSGVIKNNDILIYKDGAYVGKTTIFKDNFPFDYATINEHIFLMRAKNVLFQNFLLFTLKQNNYFEIMQSLGQKAAQPGLNQEDLKSIKILVPNQKNINDFYTYSEKSLISIFKNANQSKELQSLRDWLLPMLMNGQISVE